MDSRANLLPACYFASSIAPGRKYLKWDSLSTKTGYYRPSNSDRHSISMNQYLETNVIARHGNSNSIEIDSYFHWIRNEKKIFQLFFLLGLCSLTVAVSFTFFWFFLSGTEQLRRCGPGDGVRLGGRPAREDRRLLRRRTAARAHVQFGRHERRLPRRVVVQRRPRIPRPLRLRPRWNTDSFWLLFLQIHWSFLVATLAEIDESL